MGLLGQGGILNVILNGIQNTQAGLPFLAGPEERVGKRQMDMEMQKEKFKTQQDTQKSVISAITDIFKNPEKQTTETLKWAKDMAPQVGLDVPEGTIAGMYGQAYDKLVQRKQIDQVINTKLNRVSTKGQRSSGNYPQDKVIEPASVQSLYEATHPQTPLVKMAIAGNETEGEADPYAAQERAKGGRGQGKYQFEPETWARLAKEVAPLLQRKPSSFDINNPEDQETLATYDIDKQLKAGYRPEQVATYWQTGDPNSTVTTGTNKQGVPYDVPGYLDRFRQRYAQAEQQFAGQEGQGSQGRMSDATPLPPHKAASETGENELQGISIHRNEKGESSVTIDGSKMTPSSEDILMRHLQNNPSLMNAYMDAKVNAEIYGSEPILYTPVTDVSGHTGIQMTRKKDGVFLGINWAKGADNEPIQTKLTPEQEVEQAAKTGAASAAATVTGKAIGENTPIQSLAGKTPADIASERKLKESKLEAETTTKVKRAGEMVPLQTALSQIKEYSKKIHTQNTPAGALLNGMLLTLESKMPTGSNAKTFVDLSGAFVGHLARVYGAERGVLTEQDVKRASKLGVGLFATKEYSQERFKLLEDFSNELAGRSPKAPGTLTKGNVYPNSQGTLYVYLGINEKGEHGWKPLDVNKED